MKGKIKYSLSESQVISTPGLVNGITGTEYLSILRQALPALTGNSAVKANLYISAFEKWLERRGLLNSVITDLEALLYKMHEEMKNGAFRSSHGKAFHSLAHKLRGGVANLHNSLVGHDPRLLRCLISARHYDRYRYFCSLTPQTQAALIEFERNGTRKDNKRSSRIGRPLTEACRIQSVSEALTLMRQLKINGMENITEEQIEEYLGFPDPNNQEYRRKIRLLHSLRPLYRYCVDKGLLPHNPLNNVPDDHFNNYAVRDFIGPDALDLLLDLKSLDFKNCQAVRDRLVCLLYVDTCLRKSELALLTLGNVKESAPGIYAVEIKPDQQKMYDKPSVIIPILYDATQKVLRHYLDYSRKELCKKDKKCDALILSVLGRRATALACSTAVKRESKRLGILTYYKKKLPSPHDLRRTFPTLNSAPLGFNMELVALAERLRDGIEIVHRHYIQQNPMIAHARAEKYRKQAASAENCKNVDTNLEALENAGVDHALVEFIRHQLDKPRQAGKPTLAEGETGDNVELWISEQEALQELNKAWGILPSKRRLIEYLHQVNALKRGGPKGQLVYLKNAINHLADEYKAVATIVGTDFARKRHIKRRINSYKPIRLGYMKLIKKDDAIDLLRALNGYQDNKLPVSKVSITDCPKRAKQAPRWGIAKNGLEASLAGKAVLNGTK
jgi:site-specific recombinase XerD